MEHVNVHRRVEIITDNSSVQARRLVTRVDGFRLPICPVERRLEERQRKRMRQRIWYHLSPVAAVQVTAVYISILTVSPVKSALKDISLRSHCVVESQTVRPEYVCIDNDLSSGDVAIHSSALDLGDLTPVCPEHQPVTNQ